MEKNEILHIINFTLTYNYLELHRIQLYEKKALKYYKRSEEFPVIILYE